MAKRKYEHIFRSYYGEPRDISESANKIHEYLFQRDKSISSYGQDAANILTDFFQDLKKASQQAKINPGAAIKAEILESEINNPIILDFTKGGRSKGGIEFEQQIGRLFTPMIEESLGKGQQMASVIIDLGTKDIEQAKKDLNEYINDRINSSIEDVRVKILTGQDLNLAPPDSLFLKIGTTRYGKIDIEKSSSQETIEFNVQGQPSSKLNTALNILNKASFSIKSYKENGVVHLGETDPVKAVSAVANYVSSQHDYQDARWAGVYYIHHPNKQRKKDESKNAIKELYEHYSHMRKVFELTGIGLTYDDLNDLHGVDFLLVNRYNSDNIKVYSTQELLKTLEGNKYKYFSID